MADHRLKLRDALSLPCLISLARVPLAVLFPAVVGQPDLALAVLGAGACSDVLDGEVARRTGRVTRLGAIIDPIADKLFVYTVVITLTVVGALPLWGLVALSVREIGELPLLFWLMSRPTRRAHAREAQANRWGKNTTVLQLISLIAAVLTGDTLLTRVCLGLTAAAGLVAALGYWRRALSAQP